MTAFDKLYIDGAWTPSDASGTLDVIDSVTEEVMATIPAGSATDVGRAVAAAKAAFPAWSATSPEERAKYISRIGDALGARTDEIATTISKETGMAKWLSQLVQVGLPINSFKQAAATAESYQFEEQVGNSLVVREPIGVVGCITPWNYPLHQIAAKVAFAMAAGLHGRAQAERGRPDRCLPPRRDRRRGRPACRSVQPRFRPRARGRRGDRLPPGRRHGVVHRDRRGPASASPSSAPRRSSASPSSSAASRPTSCSTTSTARASPRPSPTACRRRS